jgi:hypothetical protein
VAFHEDFWVVVGTAAPVIALGNTVAAGQIFEALDTLRPDKPLPPVPATSLRQKMRLIRQVPGWSAYLIAVVAFTLNAVALSVALISLSSGRDIWPTLAAVVTVVAAMLLTMVEVVSLAFARDEIRRLQRRRRTISD